MIDPFELWGAAWTADPLSMSAAMGALGHFCARTVPPRRRSVSGQALESFALAAVVLAVARLSGRLSVLAMGGELVPWLELGGSDYLLCTGALGGSVVAVAELLGRRRRRRVTCPRCAGRDFQRWLRAHLRPLSYPPSIPSKPAETHTAEPESDPTDASGRDGREDS